jgi:3-hydroxyisobutyrate dehydrogenase
LAAAPVQELAAAGATAAATAAAAVKDADAVVTMLPSSPHVKAVYESAVLPSARRGTLLIDASTIDPGVTRELAAAAAARGLRMVDAPVSGGVGGAAAGTLTFMVGGTPEAFEAARRLLAAMGKNIVRCGDVGAGEAAKICNNLVLGVSMNAVSEAMNLGTKLGLEPSVLAGILNTSSGRCWSSDTYNPCPGVMPNVPAARDYEGGFGAALMQKDLGLALEAARAVNAPLPTGSAAHAVYALMTSAGWGKKDFSGVFKFLAGGFGGAGKA